MKLSRDQIEFQTRLGHTFRRPEILQRALTHSSVASPTRSDNQRLEFLGLIFHLQFPQMADGAPEFSNTFRIPSNSEHLRPSHGKSRLIQRSTIHATSETNHHHTPFIGHDSLASVPAGTIRL